MSALRSEVEDLQRQLGQAVDRESGLEASLSTARKDTQAADAARREEAVRASGLANNLATQETMVKQLQQQLAMSKQRLTSLQESNEVSHKLSDQLQQRVTELSDELAEQRRRLLAATEGQARAEASAATAKTGSDSEAAVLRQRLAAAEEELRHLVRTVSLSHMHPPVTCSHPCFLRAPLIFSARKSLACVPRLLVPQQTPWMDCPNRCAPSTRSERWP